MAGAAPTFGPFVAGVAFVAFGSFRPLVGLAVFVAAFFATR
jgi:hypothetical protein